MRHQSSEGHIHRENGPLDFIDSITAFHRLDRVAPAPPPVVDAHTHANSHAGCQGHV